MDVPLAARGHNYVLHIYIHIYTGLFIIPWDKV